MIVATITATLKETPDNRDTDKDHDILCRKRGMYNIVTYYSIEIGSAKPLGPHITRSPLVFIRNH